MGKEVAKVGLAQAVKKGWIKVDKAQKPPAVTRAANSIEDDTKALLSKVAKDAGSVDEKVLNDLKTRKLANKQYVLWCWCLCGQSCVNERCVSLPPAQHLLYTHRHKRREVRSRTQKAADRSHRRAAARV